MTITLDPPAAPLAPIDDVTRREFMIGGLSTAVLVAAGCGDDDNGDDESDETVRSFTDDRGVAVRVPARAERIVALDPQSLEAALAVGATVVGSYGRSESEPFSDAVSDQAEGIEVVAGRTRHGRRSPPDPRRLIVLNPKKNRGRTLRRRRRVRHIAVSMAVGLLAAACGDDDGNGAAPTSTATPGTVAAAVTAPVSEAETSAFPVTVAHKFGTTEIAEQPERIVALGYTDLDYVLALGLTPVAARYPQFGDESTAVRPWAREAAGDADPEVLDFAFGELGFEAIAALDPDLVLAVTSGITAEEYETLAAIAPTVAQTDDFIDFGLPWQDTALLIGRAVGRADLAEELVDEVEDRFGAARDEHPEFDGRSVASAYYGESEVLFFAAQDLRARFFTSLGFEVPAELDEIAGEEFFGSISPERLDLIDTDVLAWNQLQFTEGGRAAIEADPLVQALDVTRDGRSLFIDGEIDDALQVSTILSLPTALDGIVPMLARATDDDPATVP